MEYKEVSHIHSDHTRPDYLQLGWPAEDLHAIRPVAQKAHCYELCKWVIAFSSGVLGKPLLAMLVGV